MRSRTIKGAVASVAAISVGSVSSPASAFVAVPPHICNSRNKNRDSFIVDNPATAPAVGYSTKAGRRFGARRGGPASLRCSAAATEFDLKT